MLEFREIKIEDKEKCETYLRKNLSYFCEHSFVDIFIWSTHYKTQVAFTNEFMFIKLSSYPGRFISYLAPIGAGNLHDAISLIEADCKQDNNELLILSIDENMKTILEQMDKFQFEELRDSEDYIYDAEKMITLSGKKLHSKRNFINRFMLENEGRWKYENMTAQNIDVAREYHIRWCKQNGCDDDESFQGESCAIEKAFKNFDALSLKGGILKLDDVAIAFTLGSRANDEMFVIQIEKADSTVPGAYPMINNQFAKANCTDVKYINREEDMGLEGLRKAKLSYKPVFLAIKYEARYK